MPDHAVIIIEHDQGDGAVQWCGGVPRPATTVACEHKSHRLRHCPWIRPNPG